LATTKDHSQSSGPRSTWIGDADAVGTRNGSRRLYRGSRQIRYRSGACRWRFRTL